MTLPRTVLIVGGGLAGLATAALLRARGVPSLILEATETTGGRFRPVERGGFRWDSLWMTEKGLVNFQTFFSGLKSAQPASRPLKPMISADRVSKIESGSLGFVMRTKVGSFSSRLSIRSSLGKSAKKKDDRLDDFLPNEKLGSDEPLLLAFGGPAVAERRVTPATAFALARELVLDRSKIVGIEGGYKGLLTLLHSLAGEIRLNAKVTKLTIENGHASSVELEGGEKIECASVVLAISAPTAKALFEEAAWTRMASEERARIDGCVSRSALDVGIELNHPIADAFLAICGSPPSIFVANSALDPSTAPPNRGLITARVGLPQGSPPSSEEAVKMEQACLAQAEKLVGAVAVQGATVSSELKVDDDPAATLGGGRQRPTSTFSAFDNVFLVGDSTDSPGSNLDRILLSARTASHLASR